MSARILIGPAGWAYRDWQGVVYPQRTRRGFHPAVFLAEFFDLVELNSTFYRTPTPQVVRVWARQLAAANPNFRFTTKLLQTFTHQRRATAEDEEGVRRYLDILAERQLLGALLLQFPWSFRNTPSERQYLAELAQRFRPYPLAVEVRHGSWAEPDMQGWMREHELAMAAIDQPIIGESLPPAPAVTAPFAYVRLHGRNYADWFRKVPRRTPGSGIERVAIERLATERMATERAATETEPSSEAFFAGGESGQRYNYLYSQQELREWVTRIEQMAGEAETIYVVTNNHFQGKAVVNALELSGALLGRKFTVPPQLLRHYPHLEPLDATPHVARLF